MPRMRSDDLHQERVVGAPVEGVDERRVAKRLVPVELVQVAQERGAQRDAEIHDPDVEVLVPEDVELLFDCLRRGDVPAADVDGIDVDAPTYWGGFGAPTYCGGFDAPTFGWIALHQNAKCSPRRPGCQ